MNTRAGRIAFTMTACLLIPGALGCELIASVDRSQIPSGEGGGTTSTTTTTSSGDTTTGTGGSGGAGGGTGGMGTGGMGTGGMGTGGEGTGGTGTGGTGTGGMGTGGTGGTVDTTSTGGTGGMGTGGMGTGGMGGAGGDMTTTTGGTGGMGGAGGMGAGGATSSSSSTTTTTSTGGAMCATAADCPGVDTECAKRSCDNGQCGTTFVAVGTALMAQDPGDCKVKKCDGMGGVTSDVDDNDLPIDNKACTGDVCTMGAPTNPPLASGTSCNENGGSYCNGSGACVACVADVNCGPGNLCVNGACVMSTCGNGTQDGMETGVDCGGPCPACPTCVDQKKNGAETDVDCGGGACPACATGKTCVANADCAEGLCVGGTCTDVSFSLLRVGDGAGALSSASTAVFIEKHHLNGAPVMGMNNPLALPTAANGNNLPITLSGTATSEGRLTRSENGSYLVLAGYGVAPGTASVPGTQSMTVNRVVARIDAAGGVDTSTRLETAFNTSNVRGAASSDGTAFWVAGTGSPASSGGVWYVPLGTNTATQVLSSPSNVRGVNVFNGQLYGSSGSGTFVNVFTIGMGLPTMSGQTATSLPGMPTASASPYNFALLDHDPMVPGVDTLYVADDRSVANGGGIQKWTFDGTTWTLKATFNNAITSSNAARGVTAVLAGSRVIVIATTGETNQNKVIVYIDDPAVMSPTGLVVATAPQNTVYRDVALSPQ